MTDARTEVPRAGAGEREWLRARLGLHRDTLAATCPGLSGEELRRAPVPPSGMSLLGLVRHLAEVERSWFRRVLDGQDAPSLRGADHAGAHDVEGAAPGGGVRRLAGRGDDGLGLRGGRASLELTGADRRDGTEHSLRRVLLHLVQEHTRHNGHRRPAPRTDRRRYRDPAAQVCAVTPPGG